MWTKVTNKTWINETGEVISNQSYSMYGKRVASFYRHESYADYESGSKFTEHKTLNEAKTYEH